ncbi:MAG: hypothetical protein ACHQF3_14330 [Alphaproteobacteria bacterium]
MASWEAKWQAAKPRVLFLAIGLIVGPFITNSIGWQIMGGTAKAQMQAALVEQSALICEQRARADVKEPGKLDWTARTELAAKWGIMPGEKSTESDVKYACARKLEA